MQNWMCKQRICLHCIYVILTQQSLCRQLKDLEATVKDKRAKLGSISNQTVDKNALNKLILRHNKRRSLCMSRKTKCMDVVDSISDSMGKSIKSVMVR